MFVMRFLSSSLCAALVIGTATAFSAAHAAPAYELSRGADTRTKSILPKEKPVEPVLMLVSLRDQSMRVYSGDQMVARTHVSTGKVGHRTPTGIFSILEKRRYHESNIYSQAPMPYMQRLTWSGIALHESDSVPDHPASHGCVRLPGSFAKQLFGYTDQGTHVLVTDDAIKLRPVAHPFLIYPGGAPADMSAGDWISDAGSTISVRETGSTSVIRIVAQQDDAPSVIEISLEMRDSIDAVEPATEEPETEDDTPVVADPREPIRVLITRRTGRHLIADIQEMLNELGHDAGDADGLMGPDTGNAIVAYQKSHGLTPTGTASVSLAEKLHAETGRGTFPTGHLYVRQGFKPVFDVPVILKEPSAPLGTHFFSALSQPGVQKQIRWIHAELADTPRASSLLDVNTRHRSSFVRPVSVHAVLERIEIADDVRERLADLMAPGSSMIVTDNGLNDESHLGTDFIVLTQTNNAY